MIFYYIDHTDRTMDVQANSLSLSYALKRRSNTGSFGVINGVKPVENNDVQVYMGGLVLSSTSSTITLRPSFENDYNHFRKGQVLYINIGEVNQLKVVVESYSEVTQTITLKDDHNSTILNGSKIGELIFGGLISGIEDENIHSIGNIVYKIQLVGYSRQFDRKLVADTWEDVDARYMINSFVNSTVNYNYTLDAVVYDNNTDIQEKWLELDDASQPLSNGSEWVEGRHSGSFSWINSSGTAKWESTVDVKNVNDITGIEVGAPVSGFLMLWVKPVDYTAISSIKVTIGSDASNYTEVDLGKLTGDFWQYLSAPLKRGVTVGMPDWNNLGYINITIDQSDTSGVFINGFRLNQDMSFTLKNVQKTNIYNEYRSPQIRPSKIVNSLAEGIEYTWYIDAERDIHFKSKDIQNSFYVINDDSKNFYDLSTDIDESQVGNRIIVEGGERVSSSVYSQVVEGNGAVREWVLKNKFKNLSILLDDNSNTGTMGAGSNSTNITFVGHGLTTGDYITNRTRNNEVRSITVVNANNFVVESIDGQTSGDIFSKFTTTQTVGVEGLNDEVDFDYMSNSNEKSIRSTSQIDTLNEGEFLLFSYNERVRLQLQYTDPVSANALKSLGLGDGIRDLDKIVDQNITDLNTALVLAEAKVTEFSNPIITGGFKTNFKGFKVGDILQVDLSDRSTINDEYVIQKIKARQRGGAYSDHIEYSINFGTTLFGVIEFYQKLLDQSANLEVNTDAVVTNFITSKDLIEVNDLNILGPQNLADTLESIELTEVNNVLKNGDNWKWEVSTGQPVNTRWNLFSWS